MSESTEPNKFGAHTNNQAAGSRRGCKIVKFSSPKRNTYNKNSTNLEQNCMIYTYVFMYAYYKLYVCSYMHIYSITKLKVKVEIKIFLFYPIQKK